MGFSTEAAHNQPLLQSHGLPLSPCLTPVCGLIPVIMPRIHELCQPERDFQDPRENKGPMEAQCIGGEEEEMEVEQEEEQVKKGDAASSSFCLPAWGTLEEVAAAAIVSLSQSPLGVCPSPTAVAATLGSQSEDYGLSRQEEVPSTSHDQEDTKSSGKWGTCGDGLRA